MYEAFFGLRERPFSIAPDPQYLYMSSRHKEAMAHLSYGLSQGGCFIVLTGEVGTGKTTLCRNLLDELPDSVDIALILNANINEQELLQTVCDELKIQYSQQASQKQLLDQINAYLLKAYSSDRQTVLIIDEAQLLSRDVLEQIRLLTNLETTKAKLLQIILIGQPELNDLLTRNDLRQLAQRITARYHLGALRKTEIEEYINFRLSVAGCKQPVFSKQALNQLHKLTDGIPRKINVLADHALLAAYANTQKVVDAKTVKTAAKDVFIPALSPLHKVASQPFWAKWSMQGKLLGVAALVLLLNVGLWVFFTGDRAADSSNNSNQQELAEGVDEAALNQELKSRIVSLENQYLEQQKAVQAAIVKKAAGDDRTDAVQLEALNTIRKSASSPEELLPSLSEQASSAKGSLLAEGSLSAKDSLSAKGSIMIAEEHLDASNELPDSVLNAATPFQTQQSATAINQSLEQTDTSPVITEPGETEFSRVLEASADLTGRISAFRYLASLWGEVLPEQFLSTTCAAVSTLGLKCQTFGDWQQFRRYNRPGIFVVSHQQQLHRVLIKSLDNKIAKVLIGDTELSVPASELQARWNRNGIIFWRPNKSGNQFLQYGDRNLMLIAVRKRLNRVLAAINMPVLESDVEQSFDLDLSQKVFALQSRYGIVSDSKIGDETYMLINEALEANGTPVLAARLHAIE